MDSRGDAFLTWVSLVGAGLAHPALDRVEGIGEHYLVRSAGEALQRGVSIIRVDARLVRQHGKGPELDRVHDVEEVVRHGAHHVVDVAQILERQLALVGIEGRRAHGEPERLSVEVEEQIAADAAEHVEGVHVEGDGAVARGGRHRVVALGAQACIPHHKHQVSVRYIS